jgi:arylsulfatase
MTGKWHLNQTPLDRGWQEYFGHLSGATNFFKGDNTFRLGTEVFTVPDSGFYTTDANTDYAIEFLKKSPRDKPFFLYIAHNAPHYPLQAPREDIEKYRGKYMDGWDQMRTSRLAKQQELGIVDADLTPAPRPKDVPAWDSLTEKEQKHEDLMMATYAAMIDRVDQNIGRLVDHLKSTGQWENTLFLFLSDNGACPFQRSKKQTIENNLMPWDPDSYWTYDKGWAHANNTPFREYKQNQHEGGITTPLIAHWPVGITTPGSITKQPGHLVDIMATCLDVAETTYPTEFNGNPVGPPRGLSLSPIFAGETRTPHEAIYFSFYGKNNALRAGDWKLVNKNSKAFELYNLAEDRTELKNLKQSHPEKFKQMRELWDEYSNEVGETHKWKNRKNSKDQ